MRPMSEPSSEGAIPEMSLIFSLRIQPVNPSTAGDIESHNAIQVGVAADIEKRVCTFNFVKLTRRNLRS